MEANGSKYGDFTVAKCDGDCAVKQDHLVAGTICTGEIIINGEVFDPKSIGTGHGDSGEHHHKKKCVIWEPLCGIKCNTTRPPHHNKHVDSYPVYEKRSPFFSGSTEQEETEKLKRVLDDDDAENDDENDKCKFKSVSDINEVADRNLDCKCSRTDHGVLQCFNKNSLFVCVTTNATLCNNGTLPLQLTTTYDGKPALCFENLSLIESFGLVLDDKNHDGKCDYSDCCYDCGNVVNGHDGLPGAIGPSGQNGTDGNHGATGPIGPTGPRGATGLQGETGPRGKRGKRGLKGETGSHGKDGLQGMTGPRGHVGSTGPKGKPGNDNDCWQKNKPKVLEDECYKHTHQKQVLDELTCVVDSALPACKGKLEYKLYEYEEFPQKFICVNRTSKAIRKKKMIITDLNGDGFCNQKDCVYTDFCSKNPSLPLLCVTALNSDLCQLSSDNIITNKANGQIVACGNASQELGLSITDINNDGVCDIEDCRCRGCEGSIVAPCLCPSQYCSNFTNDYSCQQDRTGTFFYSTIPDNTTLGICLLGQEWNYNDNKVNQKFVCSNEGWVSLDRKSVLSGGTSAACSTNNGGYMLDGENCGSSLSGAVGSGRVGSNTHIANFLTPFHSLITDCSVFFGSSPTENSANDPPSSISINFQVSSSGSLTIGSFVDSLQLRNLMSINVSWTDIQSLTYASFNTYTQNAQLTSPLFDQNIPICSGNIAFGIEPNREPIINTSARVKNWYMTCNGKDLICTDLHGNVQQCSDLPSPPANCLNK